MLHGVWMWSVTYICPWISVQLNTASIWDESDGYARNSSTSIVCMVWDFTFGRNPQWTRNFRSREFPCLPGTYSVNKSDLYKYKYNLHTTTKTYTTFSITHSIVICVLFEACL